MPTVFEDTLKKDINSAAIAPGYIFYGNDSYLKKHYTDRIAEKTAGADSVFDLHRFSGDCELQEVYDALLQFPLISEKKCIILTDYDFEKADKTDFERILNILGELNGENVFILRFDTVPFDDRRSARAKKIIAAMEKSGGRAVKLDHRRPAELARMLTESAARRGCKMDSAAAKYLTEAVGSDINILKNELDKLCCYTGSGVIDKAAVDTVCAKTVESSVYDLTAKIFACDIPGAMRILDGLFFMHAEPMVILYTVSGAYVDMYRVAAAKKGGADIEAVSHQFNYGAKKFLLERAASNLKKFDGKKLQLSFDALLDADAQLKSFGGNSRIILEQLAVRLCFIIAKGKPV